MSGPSSPTRVIIGISLRITNDIGPTVGSVRTIDDQWDITSSVGATALAVAAGRAVETRRADGLVDDPLAAAFVAAAGSTVLPARPWDDEGWRAQSTYLGVRSRFFDQALRAAAGTGTRQVVLLAAGLDTRALRLDWPSGTTVYEVDQARILEFKDRVVAEHPEPSRRGAAARRVAVPVDLRHDWPGALRAAGFDPARRTAWLAEGLLPYLPAEAEALLFDRVQELSAPGSRIAVEHFGDSVDAVARDPRFASTARAMFGTDLHELFFDEPRAESPGARLDRSGWAVTATPAGALAERYRRPLHPDVAAHLGRVQLIDAELPTV